MTMRSLMFAVLVALAVAMGALAWSHASSAEAGAHNLVLRSPDGTEQPAQNAEQFLTAVTQDVDAY
jgi:hypothetical protein